eukprot:TRINITY_DN40710_c0_g1_i1.p1 TRINITY_DN40710_c0_g1~~TRINITY_DN40710_c0_g1_i1.p1  ORF type:complete len:923 (-),score=125.15 TRINITY_DN40710_c0_g1_i1:109-2826(-)
MPTFKSLAKSTLQSVKTSLKHSGEKAAGYTKLSKQGVVANVAAPAVVDDSIEVHSVEALPHVLEQLIALTSGKGANPVLQPLGRLIASLDQQTMSQDCDRELAIAQLVRATIFLSDSAVPAMHLQFALSAQSHQGKTHQWLGSIEGALAVLLRPSPTTQKPLCSTDFTKIMMAWQSAATDFLELSREAWQLHALFVFLDVKGDYALLQLTAIRLSTLLRCSMGVLAACLIRTKPWIEETLKALANMQHPALFERLFLEALQEWHKVWLHQRKSESQSSSSAEENICEHFWEIHFSNVQNIAWADFAEAFESFFLYGRAPVDVIGRLREKLDPSKQCKVSRRTWRLVMNKCGCITNLVDVLMKEVREDISTLVYRKQPLPQISPVRLSEAQANEAILALSRTVAFRASASQNVRNSSNCDLASKPVGSTNGSTSNSATPSERPEGLRAGPGTSGQSVFTWDGFCAQKWAENRPFWAAPGESPSREEIEVEANLRMEALRVVSSAVSYTNTAMVVGVVSGGMSGHLPVIEMPAAASNEPKLPSLVICANGTHFNGVTRFGREEQRSGLPLDFTMSEPVASRSHFSVVFDQETHHFKIMDNGSKWGTFLNLKQEHILSCGDWIRAANAEWIIRYCGGRCESKQGHSHYKLHGVRVVRDHKAAINRPLSMTADAHDRESPEGATSSHVEMSFPLVLNSGKPNGWVGSSASMSFQGVSQFAGLSSSDCASHLDAQSSSQRREDDEQALPCRNSTLVPLELDFVSGGRMGEKIIVNTPVATLGRSADSTIHIGDSAFANVSRTHCVFRHKNGRWTLRDSNSTNGTWRRTSCILEPSRPTPLETGDRVLAGVHEFTVVEQATMTYWCAQSAGVSALHALFQETCRGSLRHRGLHSKKASSKAKQVSSTTVQL